MLPSGGSKIFEPEIDLSGSVIYEADPQVPLYRRIKFDLGQGK